MPLTNREAFDLKRNGKSVIVICNGCDKQVWTGDSIYVEGEDEWYCESCNDDLVDEIIEEAQQEDINE